MSENPPPVVTRMQLAFILLGTVIASELGTAAFLIALLLWGRR